jgi:hypothetical protein
MAVSEIGVDSSPEIPRVDMDESPVPCIDKCEPEGGADVSLDARSDVCYVIRLMLAFV